MSDIRKLYVASFFYGLGSIGGFTFTLYFLYHKLTFTEIGLLFAIFMIALALFEIPTGGYADTVGHKKSVYTGMFIEALYFFIFFFTTEFYGFLLGMIVAAFGIALQSGAIQSLMYEILKDADKHDEYAKTQSRFQTISILSGIIAAPLGTLLFTYAPQLPYALSFFFISVAAVYISSIRWEFIKKKPNLKNYLQNIKIGTKLLFQSHFLLGLTIIAFALSTLRMVFGQTINQPYQLSIGIQTAEIGVVLAIASALMALTTFYSHKVLEKFGANACLILMILVTGVCAIALSFIHSYWGLLFLFLHGMGHAFRNPIMSAITQKEIPSEQRSTITSTSSFIGAVAVGIAMPIWGMIIDVFGIYFSLFYLGFYTLAIGSLGYFISKRTR